MTVLVTGGGGFLAAWIIRRLLARGRAVRVFDQAENRRLLHLIVGPAADQVEWLRGDIARAEDVRAAAAGTSAIIHMAGVLTPFCAENPVRGAEINLIGTLQVFEAARALGHRKVIYTSSAGVYGPDDGHSPLPHTHYGAFKLACEGAARAYYADHGISSIGFRPFVVYGPGRESGGSAGPSLAARAAAWGEAYTIPFSGASGLVYVDDVAAAYEAAVLREIDGAHVVNMSGIPTSNERVIEIIRGMVPDARLSIAGPPLTILPDLDIGNIATVLPGVLQTSVEDGLAATVAFYRTHAKPNA